MQYLLIAYDGIDKAAPERRLKVRGDHLKKIGKLKEDGEFLYGGAILNEYGEMIGSMIVYNFPDRKTLDERLEKEPYLTEGVWKKIEIHPFRQAKIE